MNKYHFKLNIAGEADIQNSSCLSKRNLKELISNENINFIGKSTNMLDLYKKMDIIVLPSWREGLSKSLLEACAMSLPIITTNVPGCKDLITHNYSGLLIPVKAKNDLKEAIKNLLENESLAISLGINARNVVAEKFTTKIINNKILDLYSKIYRDLK